VALLSWIVEGAMAIGWIRIALRLHDGRPATVRDLIPDSTTLLAYLATALLYGLIVGVGLALLIVPGIYLAVRLSPYGFVVVDEKAHPWFALRRASALTEHVRWRLLGFGLLLFLINLLGAVLFGVGLVITMPVSAMATAHVFRRLQARAVERPPAPAHPAPLPT
jgi:uncharacterized membrane protein